MTARKLILSGISLAVLAGAILGGAALVRRMREPEQNIPTTRVRRGRLELKVYTTGDLRPTHTAMLVAPPVGGGLQIVRLLKTGTRVDPGDVVIEFDPSEQEYNLAQSRSELEQAEQEIIKMKADAAVREAEEQVALLKARFDVRRAELEVGRNELLAAIPAKKNLLNFEEAKRRLEQMEQDLQSRKISTRADLAVLEERLNRARLAMQQAQQNIESMSVKTPINGIVALKENMDASGGFFYSGMVLPEYRAGDQVWPGRMIAEVLEVEQMEIRSRIKETDRGNLFPDQAVQVAVDALPGRTFSGKVKSVAGLASSSFFSDDAMRTFDAIVQLSPHEYPLRSGVSAQVTIFGEQVKDALLLPRQALFKKEGKPVVYVKSGKALLPQEVKIVRATEDLAEIEGLNEGTEVALVNPEAESKKPRRSAIPLATATRGSRP
jgi:multidrug resistance efflux pump